MNEDMTLEERVSALEKQCVVANCANEATEEHHLKPVATGLVTRNQEFDPETNPKLDICIEHHDMIHEVKKNYGGYSLKELQKQGIEKLKAAGKKYGGNEFISDKQKLKVVKLSELGLTYRQIQKQVGISLSSISTILKLPIKEVNAWGRLPIPKEKISEIISLKEQGLSVRKIAKKTGVSTGSISKYARSL